jgi:hypothetical protein
MLFLSVYEVGGQGLVGYYGSRKTDRWPRVGFKVKWEW